MCSWFAAIWATSSENVSSGVCDLETRDIILSKEWTTKVLIRLRRCAGWSVPLLFAYGIKHVFAWPGPFYSRLKVLSKRFKCSILVWNYSDDVNVLRSNRWHHLLCWCNAILYATSGGLSLTVAFFLRRFGFITLNAIWVNFIGAKLCFHPILCPLKHAEQDQIDAKCLEKVSKSR